MIDPVADLRRVLTALERPVPDTVPPDLGSDGRMHVYVFDDVVVKFDGRHHSGSMVRERSALELLAGTDLPVPQLVAAGDLPDGRRWCAITKLAGEPPPDALIPAHDVSPPLARQMGEQIARLHQAVQPPGFGTWDRGTDTTLIEEEKRRLGVFEEMGREARIVPDEELDALLALMEKTRLAMESAPSTPVLAHRDVQPRNTLVAAGELCGLIDFESSAGGDPAEDFNVLGLDWTTPGFAAFVEGYAAQGGQLGQDAADRMAHYVMRWALVAFVYLGRIAPQYLEPARTAIARVTAGERPDLSALA